MSDRKEKIENLKDKIIKAFSNVSYPKDFITNHECDECFAVRKAFLNKSWKEITPSVLEENYDKLPLFSPEAFHCFLPAYLVYSLENFVYEGVCEFTLYTLTPNREIKINPIWWQERFKEFNLTEFNLIYEFLDLAEQHEEFIYHKTNIEKGKQRLKEFVELTLKK